MSAAGFTLLSTHKNDDDSIDALILARQGPGPRRSPRLEIQFKSTSSPTFNSAGTHLVYSLKQKNYNDLTLPGYHVPRILAVLVLPPVIQQWLSLTEHCLSLYHGCYWRSLRGLQATTNQYSTDVLIKRDSLLTVEVLESIMLRIARRRTP
jgi:hypothetical protein